MRRTSTVLAAVVAALVALVLPTQASGHQLRGFNGHLTGQATFVPTTNPACVNPPLQTVSTGTGAAAQMGPVTMSSLHCSGNTIAGNMTLTGTQGTVTVHYQGDCTPYQPAVTTLVECNLDLHVTGGSGRYAGASGSGEMHAVVTPQSGSTPWPASWTWKGRIAY